METRDCCMVPAERQHHRVERQQRGVEVQLVPQQVHGKEGAPINVQSQFLVLTTGIVMVPRVPQIPGIEKFKGACFHTAR